MRTHDLYRDATGWGCAVCTWHWTRPPATRCPGLPRYAPTQIPDRLRSWTQLRRAGLKPGGSPVGCVYQASWHQYYWLYDTHTVSPRRRATPAQRAALAGARAVVAEARRLALLEEELADEDDDVDWPSPADLQMDRMSAARWAQELLTRQDWVIFDTETTGLDGDAEIVQIGVLAPDGTVLLDSLVCLRQPIPAAATQIHGITNTLAATAPCFPVLYPQIISLLQTYRVVGYNAAFDFHMLEHTCERWGLPLPTLIPWECVMEWYAGFYGEWSAGHGDYRRQPLPGGDHTAIGDCRATLRLIQHMALAAEPT